MSSTSQYASDGTTLVEVIRRFEADGYTAQMAAVEGCAIRCFACHADSPAQDVRLDLVRRTEGASDPADMVAVAGLRCPRCDAKGTVALKYGPLATSEEAEVLALLDAHHEGPAQAPPV
jgi:cytochrome c1